MLQRTLSSDVTQRWVESNRKLLENSCFLPLLLNLCPCFFHVQGGDPTGTGRGGQSLWGAPFEDEVNDSLSHNKEGILSMANSGANCNKSQFFMTFAKCPHLDGKHTIFGQVVGGMRVLKAIEAVDSNDANQPLKPIKLLSTKIYNNPFEDVAAKQKASSSVEKKAVAVKDNPYLQHMC